MTEKWSPPPQDELGEALVEADLRVLLMVLFHLTGDRKWIAAPYLPKRDVNLIADKEAGLPADIGRGNSKCGRDVVVGGSIGYRDRRSRR